MPTGAAADGRCASSTSRTSSTGARRVDAHPGVVETLSFPRRPRARVPIHLRWTRTCGPTLGPRRGRLRHPRAPRWFRVVEREVRIPGSTEARWSSHRAAVGPHVGTLTPKSWPWRGCAPQPSRAGLAVVTGDMVTSGTDYHETSPRPSASCARAGCLRLHGQPRLLREGGAAHLQAEGPERARAADEGQVVERGGPRCGSRPSTTRGRGVTISSWRCAGVPKACTPCCSRTIRTASTRRRRRADLVLSGHTHDVAGRVSSRRLSLAKSAAICYGVRVPLSTRSALLGGLVEAVRIVREQHGVHAFGTPRIAARDRPRRVHGRRWPRATAGPLLARRPALRSAARARSGPSAWRWRLPSPK